MKTDAINELLHNQIIQQILHYDKQIGFVKMHS